MNSCREETGSLYVVLLGWRLCLVFACGLSLGQSQPPSFTDITPASFATNLFNPEWGDYDADGDLDLYASGRIFRNDGGLNFTNVATLVFGTRTGVAWGDYDRDGDLDLVIAGNGPTRIYKNTGGDNFINIAPGIPEAISGAAVSWGDYDNDGDLDLAFLADVGGGFGRVYRNDGADRFVGVHVGIRALTASAAAWGDYDKDGDLDLLVSGFRSGPSYYTIIYRNDGGTFVDISAGLGIMANSSVAWGDYNSDGYLDALVAGRISGTYFGHIHRNNQNGTFTTILDVLQGTADGTGEWVDYDNDGHLDIFLSGASDGLPVTDYATRLYRNNGDGTFSEVQTGLPKSTTGAWADVDSDGDLDLFLTGSAAGTRLFRNDAGISNTPPTPPSGLTTTLLPDNDVLLSWSSGADAETKNTASLSYAVRVGTVSGGADVLSPDADLATGFRRLPAPGALSGTQWILRDIPRGTNYWSVQAIDGGWVGSPFAAEASFVITNGRPVISTITNQLTVPGRPTAPISFTVSDLETPPENLVLTGASTNTALVPEGNITFGGAGDSRTVTVTPAPGLSGTATIIVTVADSAGLVASTRFELVVQTFTDASAGMDPFLTYLRASTWGDYDHDGDLDIATQNRSTATVGVYRNNSGVFSNLNLSVPYRDATDLAWVDYNNDGYIDLAANGWQSSGYFPFTSILRNNFGTNSFTWVDDLAITNFAEGSMDWADYDNDGDFDVLITGDPDTYHWINGGSSLSRNARASLTNSGTQMLRAIFTNSGLVLPAVARGDAAFADYDSDGDFDILIAGQLGANAASAVTKLFRNDGFSLFTEVPTGLPAVTLCSLAFGDYNNDGRSDILLAGLDVSSNCIARIYRNSGNGAFVDSGASLTGVEHAAVAWGDYDNDGFLDALVAGFTNVSQYYNYPYSLQLLGATTRLYRNNSGTSFTDTGSALPGAYKNAASWGDYDNDGDLDLLLGARIYRNHRNIPNTVPAAPPGLTTDRIAGGVQFVWSPSTDTETVDSRGLTYNLRVGITPGGSEIMSGQADPVTGLRRIAEPGNVGAAISWRMPMTNGTYYWSVQAIDTTFAGSGFAPETTLRVSAPVISAISNRSAFPHVNVSPIAFTVGDAETPASSLTLAVSSSNTNVIANTNLFIAGGPSNRTLVFSQPPVQPGRTVITISATDADGEIGASSFVLTVEQFADTPDALAGIGPAAWGDYDNDGDLDLVCASIIYTSNGDGSFAAMDLGYSPVASATWGDYDNDSDLDLLLTGYLGFRVYRNDGNQTFVPVVIRNSANTGPGAWGDYDNDGALDFALSSSFAISIYRNMNSNVFLPIPGSLPPANSGSVAWGDYDNDGDLDLLTGGVRVFRNNGQAPFTEVSGPWQGISGTAAWGDFDNDGDLDFAAAGFRSGSQGPVTKIYRNTGSSQPGSVFSDLYPDPFFGGPPAGPAGLARGTVVWGDYDNDGDLDLLISGESVNQMPLTKLYRNDNGAFNDSGHLLPGLRDSFAAWGDFDRDGDLDLALSGRSVSGQPLSRIYRNYHAGGCNRPPTVPFALTNSVFGKSVTFSWSRSSDRNQAGGHSYNLRVGGAPGEGTLVSPMADTNGLRRVVTLGNVGQRQSWTITNVPGGTFYWSVQAIDHSFAGSRFATEQIVTVPNLAPVTTNQSVVTAEDTPVWIPLAGADPDNDPMAIRVLTAPAFGHLAGLPSLPYVLYVPYTQYAQYVPATNYFGADQFTYVVNDRTINSSPATVSIQVTPVQDVAEPSLRIHWLHGDAMRLSLLGEPWEELRIEVSDDLINWATLTNFVGTNLVIQWTDPDAANFQRRFYRARWTQSPPP